jgi:hypothetical protein
MFIMKETMVIRRRCRMADKRREPWQADDEEMDKGVRSWGEETFGDPDPGPRYRCPDHGIVYAGDVIWGRDGKPYCPTAGCREPLEWVE